MKTFFGLVLYAAVGGLLVVPATQAIDKECGTKTRTVEFAAAVAVWPALVVGALFIESDGKIDCETTP